MDIAFLAMNQFFIKELDMKRALLLIGFLLYGSMFYAVYQIRPVLEKGVNGVHFLESMGLWHVGVPLRLHLGCGEQHLNGYINIDYPPSEHTIQTKCAADVFAEIVTLDFPPQSVDEIRSHHVFEHFDRATALALLCKWYSWLKVGGTLIIETPDFEESYKLLSNQAYTYCQKQVVVRHIFGSHEAHWAIHKDGWYQDKFEHILNALGFGEIQCKKTAWLMLRNITVEAKKQTAKPLSEICEVARQILHESTVDGSETENKIWRIWCQQFSQVGMGIE
jgi:predicted SAM-dependent methyltransferase